MHTGSPCQYKSGGQAPALQEERVAVHSTFRRPVNGLSPEVHATKPRLLTFGDTSCLPLAEERLAIHANFQAVHGAGLGFRDVERVFPEGHVRGILARH